MFEKRVWRGRRGVGKSGGAEEAGIRRKNNGRICTRVQVGGKKEQV